MAKVIGYNITEDVILLDDIDTKKPILNVVLKRHGSKIEIFDMSTYGLHFAKPMYNEQWTKIR